MTGKGFDIELREMTGEAIEVSLWTSVPERMTGPPPVDDAR
jgi:hypothetical protein